MANARCGAVRIVTAEALSVGELLVAVGLMVYLWEKADMHALSPEQLDEIAAELNEGPRQTLEFLSPSEALAAALR